MRATRIKAERRQRRKLRVRKRVSGTAERPRLTVFRSSMHIYAQLVDDLAGVTLCEASSQSKELRESCAYGGNIKSAKVVGAALAARAKEKNISLLAFDRNGYRYHGRVKALADAAREAGLGF